MLTRRDLLWSAAGASAAAIAGSVLADLTARHQVLQPPMVRPPSPVLLRTDAPEGWQFAQGLRAAGQRFEERPWDRLIEVPFAKLEMLSALPAGTRVFAFVQDSDAVLIESVLGPRLQSQWHRAHHASGPLTSRHVIENTGFLEGMVPRLVERLDRSDYSYDVRPTDGKGIHLSMSTRTSAPRQSWPAEMASLMANQASKSPAVASLSSMTNALFPQQPGCCHDATERFVSLLVDL